MPAKRKRSVPPDGVEEREESPVPTIKRKKKSLQYDSVSCILFLSANIVV